MSNSREDYNSLLSILDDKDDVTRYTDWSRTLAASPELQVAWRTYRHAARLFEMERTVFRETLEALRDEAPSKYEP